MDSPETNSKKERRSKPEKVKRRRDKKPEASLEEPPTPLTIPKCANANAQLHIMEQQRNAKAEQTSRLLTDPSNRRCSLEDDDMFTLFQWSQPANVPTTIVEEVVERKTAFSRLRFSLIRRTPKPTRASANTSLFGSPNKDAPWAASTDKRRWFRRSSSTGGRNTQAEPAWSNIYASTYDEGDNDDNVGLLGSNFSSGDRYSSDNYKRNGQGRRGSLLAIFGGRSKSMGSISPASRSNREFTLSTATVALDMEFLEMESSTS